MVDFDSLNAIGINVEKWRDHLSDPSHSEEFLRGWGPLEDVALALSCPETQLPDHALELAVVREFTSRYRYVPPELVANTERATPEARLLELACKDTAIFAKIWALNVFARLGMERRFAGTFPQPDLEEVAITDPRNREILAYHVQSWDLSDIGRVVMYERARADEVYRDWRRGWVRHQPTLTSAVLVRDGQVTLKAPTAVELRVLGEYLLAQSSLTEVREPELLFSREDHAKVIRALSTPPPSVLADEQAVSVTEVTFHRALIVNSPSLRVRSQKRGDLTPSIKDLTDTGLLDDFSITEVDEIKCRVGDKQWTIKRFDDTGYLAFRLTGKASSSAQFEGAKLRIENRLQLPLNTRLKLASTVMSEAGGIDYIMSFQGYGHLEGFEEIRVQLEKDNYLTVDESVSDTCPRCGSDEMDPGTSQCVACGTDLLSRTYVRYLPRLDGLIDHLNKILMDCGYSTILTELDRPGVPALPYVIVNPAQHQPVAVFAVTMDERGFLAKRLHSIRTPAVVLPVGRGSITLTDPRWLVGPTFGQFLARPEAARHRLKSAINSLEAWDDGWAQKFIDARQALHGIDRGQTPDGYTWKRFENDAFAVMHSILPNSILLGASFSGRRVPDACFLNAFNDDRDAALEVTYRAYVWDCKFAEGDHPYPLGAKEQRQAVEYIKKLIRTPWLRKVRRGEPWLDAYVIVSNHVTAPQFQTFCANVRAEIPNWRGTMALLDLSVLLDLASRFDASRPSIDIERNQFMKGIHDLLGANEQTDKIVSTEDVNVLLATLQNHGEVEHATEEQFRQSYPE